MLDGVLVSWYWYYYSIVALMAFWLYVGGRLGCVFCWCDCLLIFSHVGVCAGVAS